MTDTVTVRRLFLGLVVLFVISLTALAFWVGCFAIPKLFKLPSNTGWVFFACLMIIWMDCRSLLNHIIGFQEEQSDEETE